MSKFFINRPIVAMVIAILMVILDIGRDEAERIAAEHDGHISLAIEAYRSGKIS